MIEGTRSAAIFRASTQLIIARSELGIYMENQFEGYALISVQSVFY